MPNQTRDSWRHFADFVARDALLILGFVYKVLGVTIVSYLVFGACGRRLSLLLLVVSLPHVMCCSVDGDEASIAGAAGAVAGFVCHAVAGVAGPRSGATRERKPNVRL